MTRVERDHDHATEQERGLLCPECNKGLGKFSDSPHFLLNAIQYLFEVRSEKSRALTRKLGIDHSVENLLLKIKELRPLIDEQEAIHKEKGCRVGALKRKLIDYKKKLNNNHYKNRPLFCEICYKALKPSKILRCK